MIVDIDADAKRKLIESTKLSNTTIAFRYYVFTTYSFNEYFMEAAFIYLNKAIEYCSFNDVRIYVIIDLEEYGYNKNN